MALQPGVGLGLLYNMPPGLSIPCTLYSFTSIFLRFMDTSSSHLIFGLPLRLVAYSFLYNIFFWDCGVLHSFYMTKPPYSLAFNKPDNVQLPNITFNEVLLNCSWVVIDIGDADSILRMCRRGKRCESETELEWLKIRS